MTFRVYGGLGNVALHVVEAETDVMAELDAWKFADTSLLSDPRFGDAKMLGELAGVQKLGEAIIVCAGVALGEQTPEDLRFERFERGCAIGDLFEGVAHLIVCEGARVLRMRDEVVDHDFWLCGHGQLAFSKCAQPA